MVINDGTFSLNTPRHGKNLTEVFSNQDIIVPNHAADTEYSHIEHV